jgi:Protein of unknown function (DUF2877)
MNVTALSTSAALRPVIDGPLRHTLALGRNHLDVEGYVISLTRPGGPRMPNGIEVDVRTTAGEHAEVGKGRITIGQVTITPGPTWDPIPRPALTARQPSPADGLLDLVGRGPGLTPAGDDLLAGYLAGLVLLHGRNGAAQQLAAEAATLTTILSATLLLHASRGEVPEPVHAFLERADAIPLLGFGHSSGRFWLLGLTLAGASLIDGSPFRPGPDGDGGQPAGANHRAEEVGQC